MAELTRSEKKIAADIALENKLPVPVKEAVEELVAAQSEWLSNMEDPRTYGGTLMEGIQRENRERYAKVTAAQEQLKSSLRDAGMPEELAEKIDKGIEKSLSKQRAEDFAESMRLAREDDKKSRTCY